MASKYRDLVARFLGDSKGFERASGRVRRDAGKTDQKVQRFSKSIKGALGVAAAGGAIRLGAELFNTGVQIEAMERRFEKVFGDSGTKLNTWLKQNAERFGMSDERARGMAAAVGDLLIPMGFARGEAARMTEKVLTTAAALKEFTGDSRSQAEIAQIVAKAFTGEREGLKDLGAGFTEAELKARLLEKGQAGLTGQALDQAKAIATIEIVMEKSTDALSDFKDGQTDAEAAASKFSSNLDELKVNAGKLVTQLDFLVSAGGDLLGVFTGDFGQDFSAATEILRKAGPELAGSLAGAQRMFDLVGDSVDFFRSDLADADRALIQLAKRALPLTAEALAELEAATQRAADSKAYEDLVKKFQVAAADIIDIWKGLPDEIEDFEFDIQEAISNAIETRELAREFNTGMRTLAALGLEGLAREIASNPNRQQGVVALREVLSDLEAAFDLEEAITGQVDAALAALERRITGSTARWDAIAAFFAEQGAAAAAAYAGGLGGGGGGSGGGGGGGGRGGGQTTTSGRPAGVYHEGGVVPGPPGTEVPAILEAGETVLPTQKSGLKGGMTTNVTVNVSGSVIAERELVETIRRALIRHGRRDDAGITV